MVTLQGEIAAGSPPPGNIVYQWAQTAGRSVTLSNPNTINASFVATAPGNYEFRLTGVSGTVTQQANTSVVVVAPVVTPVQPVVPVFGP